MYTNKQIATLLQQPNIEAQAISSSITSVDSTYKSSSTRSFGYVDFPNADIKLIFTSHPQSHDSTVFEIQIKNKVYDQIKYSLIHAQPYLQLWEYVNI